MTSGAITVRDASAADAAAVAAIWNHYIRDTAVTFNAADKSAAEVADLIATREAFLVAEVDGTVAGFATWVQFRAGVGYRFTIENTVLLAPGRGGQGIGRALMGVLADRARAAGHHAMWAGVSAENPAGVAFHAALGFREIARLPQVGHKFGRWMDLVLMQLPL